MLPKWLLILFIIGLYVFVASYVTYQNATSSVTSNTIHTANYVDTNINSTVNVSPPKIVDKRINDIIATICCIVRNEERYIEEWIQYNLLLHFDKIYIYDNSNDSSMIKYFDIKIKNHLYSLNFEVNKISIIHYPGLQKQIEAYNHCFERQRKTLRKGQIYNTWVAFIDVDEFIVLKKDNNIKSFLYKYITNFNSLSLTRYQFGSNGHKSYGDGNVLNRFIKRELYSSGGTKSIVRMKYTVRISNAHFANILDHGHIIVGSNESNILLLHNDKKEKQILWGNPKLVEENKELFNCAIACINHYYLKSMQYWIDTKMKRGRISRKRKNNYTIQEWIDKNKLYNQMEDTFARNWYHNTMQSDAHILIRNS